MKLIRIFLGFIIGVIDRLTAPRPLLRSEPAQAARDRETEGLTLYQLETCPFCVKVRRQIRRQSLKIRLKEIDDPVISLELVEGGKQDQVPCLRIEKNGSVQWLYESDAINTYLVETFPN